MATYPYSVARLVSPNASQVNKRDQRVAAIQRRLRGRKNRTIQRGSTNQNG